MKTKNKDQIKAQQKWFQKNIHNSRFLGRKNPR